MPEAETVKKRWERKEYWLGGLALLVTIALCFVAIYYWEDIAHLGRYGYLGAFIVSLLAATMIGVPIPYIVVIFTMGGVLNPTLLGLAGGLGASLGSLLIFVTAYGGSRLVSNTPRGLYYKVSQWVHKRGSLAVFAMSAIFNPLYAPMTIALAMLRFRPWKFFLLSWAGNTVKSLIISYCGYFGLGSLLRSLGIGV